MTADPGRGRDEGGAAGLQGLVDRLHHGRLVRAGLGVGEPQGLHQPPPAGSPRQGLLAVLDHLAQPALDQLAASAGVDVPSAIADLFDKPVTHATVVDKDDIEREILAFLEAD